MTIMALHRTIKQVPAIALLGLFMLIAAYGCKEKQNELLRLVPADAEYCVRINAQSLFTGLTEVKKDYPQIATPGWMDVFDGQDAEWTEAIDMKNIMFFGNYDQSSAYFVANITDVSHLRKLLVDKDWHKADATGVSMEVWASDGDAFIAIDTTGPQVAWITSNKLLLNNIEHVKRDAAAKSIAEIECYAEVLESSATVDAVLSIPTMGNGFSSPRLVVRADIKQHCLEIDATPTLPNGTTLQNTYTQSIDTDILRHMPSDMQAIAAIGLTDQVPWSDLLIRIMPALSISDMATIRSLLPYLESIDGTVAVGANNIIASSQESPRQLLLLAEMPRQKAQELARIIASAISATPDATGHMYSAVMSGLSVRIASIDGLFILSLDMPIVQSCQAQDNNLFEGQHAVLWARTPLVSDLLSNILPVEADIDLAVRFDGTTLHATLSLDK